ncbi:MAG: hypothetical protein A3A86_07225 [Elusimicrobia bacterium RIFCSPLOWO2_01_FULL_60_11]|nr:MAG: hypothetical protein A3A86_07225 [Elusimicrobia bacterium RIFCSPLOWO2_01_FULL_60_11]
MAQKIFLAFLWHQHQPFYEDLRTGRAALPWVRLHGTKDYHDMAALLKKFPKIRVTFNLVPSLLLQLDNFAQGRATDAWLEKTLIPAADLTRDDKVFILENFFFCNWDNMIFPNTRYAKLFEKRGHFASHEKIARSAGYFTAQEFLDLQVWFNLAWVDPLWRGSDAGIDALFMKGRDFTEEDKRLLVRKQKEICAAVAGIHKELWDKGQIEVSTTPFYHPILPLLCDTDSAQMSMPGSLKPKKPFKHPEDAEHQVTAALEYMEKTFGRRPQGFWPSEGSVSEEAAGILARAGVKWAATDEGVLFRSLDREKIPHDRSALYRPYLVETPAGEKIRMVFRDHGLSDSIGFVYARMEAAAAAADFIHRIERTADSIPEGQDPPLLSIILDGENCWEHFRNDGNDFLSFLYAGLSDHPRIETATIGGYLERFPPRQTLRSLWAGSWINHDFAIWIGHPEDNRAWDLVSEAREFLADASRRLPKDDPALRAAWECLYIAEGSDWCWWYGDQNSTAHDAVFDKLFRDHLKNVYIFLGEKPPQKLDMAIKGKELKGALVTPSALIQPKIDGMDSSYFEWRAAGSYQTAQAGGTMHQTDHLLAFIRYGFDLENLYLRLDARTVLKDLKLPDIKIKIDFIEPSGGEIQISWEDHAVKAVYMDPEGAVTALQKIASKKVVELAVPFDVLGKAVNEPVEFTVAVIQDGVQTERWPYQSSIRLARPDADFGSEIWNA